MRFRHMAIAERRTIKSYLVNDRRWVGWVVGSGPARSSEGKGGATCGGRARELASLTRSKGPCEAELLTKLRAWEVGHRGNLGGCCSVAAVSAGFPGGVWEQGGRATCGRKEGAETFSKDSSRLSPSSIPIPVHLCCVGNIFRALAPVGVVDSESLPPSEERE